MSGILYGVGVGPGDPELLTIKALRRIEKSPVIAVPAREKERSAAYKIVAQAVKDLNEKEILCIDMPMTRDREKLLFSHKAGAEQLIRILGQGKDIAFLTLGDPGIYSTYMYLHRLVAGKGYQAEIISGVPSFCAASALLGEELVKSDEMLHLVPSAYGVEDALKMPGTKVLMKAGKKMPQIRRRLEEMDAEAHMVENCGMANEKIYHGADQMPEDAGYYSLIIVKNKRGAC